MGATSSSPPPPPSTDPSTRSATHSAPAPAGALCTFSRCYRPGAPADDPQPCFAPPAVAFDVLSSQLATLGCVAAVLVVAPVPRGRDGARARHEHRDGRPRRPRPADRRGDLVAASRGGRARRARVARRPAPALGRRAGAARFEAVGITLPAPPAEPVFLRGRVGGTLDPLVRGGLRRGRGTGSRRGGSAARRPQPAGVAGGCHRLRDRRPASVTTVRGAPGRGRDAPRRSVTIQSSAAGARERAGDHRPGRLGSAATTRAPGVDRRPEAGHRPPLGERQHLLRRPGACRPAVDPGVPPGRPGVERHRLQLRRRPLRAHLGGAGRWHRPRSCSAVTAPGFNTGSVGVVVLGDLTSAAGVRGCHRGDRQRHRLEVRPAVGWTRHRRCRTPPPGRPSTPAGTTVMLPRIVGHRDVQSHELPRCAAVRAAEHDPGGSLSSCRATRPTRHRPSWPPTSTATVGRTPSSTVPVRPGTCIWRSTGTAGFTKQVPAITDAYRPVVGRPRRQRLRRHRLARLRQRPGRHLVVAGRRHRQPGARRSTASYVPFVGDFDGNGWTTSSGTAPGSGPRRCGTSAPTAPSRRCGWPRTSITGVPVVGDFDGDGRDDIFWYGPGPADDELWWSTGQAFRRTHLAVDRLVSPRRADATRRAAETTSCWSTPPPRRRTGGSSTTVGRS